MNPLLQRQAAIRLVVERYGGKEFAWGNPDCARPVACLLNALGYKPRLSRFGAYSTALGAYRALKKHGFDDVPDWLDSIPGLFRIPFARALPADILAVAGGAEEGEDEILAGKVAITIHLGGDKMLGFEAPAPHRFGTLPRDDLPLICWSADPVRGGKCRS